MKKLFALLTLCAVVFAACEKEPNNNYGSTLKPSVKEVEFGHNGGTKSVTFTIENSKGGKVTAEDNADWLDATVEFNSEVVITADANTGEAREAEVTLNYEHAKSVVIIVKQRASSNGEYDVEFTVKRFEGNYFGSENSSINNYYIILSDIGANSDGSPKANGTYYFFDMYHSTKADAEYPILPNGNYEYDTTNSYANLTFSEESSWYAVMDANGKYAKTGSFADATVTVEDGKFEAIIEFESGEKHKVTFEGELLTTIGHIRSTFTEDVEFAVEGATITASLFGDADEDGQNNWFIEAKKGDEIFMVDVFTSSSDSCAGIYQMLEPDSKDFANRYLPGFVGEDGLVGTWYAKLTNGVIKGDALAPMTTGVIRLSIEGDTLRIEYGCNDDAGNQITGYVAGAMTVKDMRE